MIRMIRNILDAVYRSGRDWLYDAVYAVFVLTAAVTFPVWAVPYWVWKKWKEIYRK